MEILNDKLLYIAELFTSKLPMSTYNIDFENSVLTINHISYKLIVHKDNVEEILLRLDKIIEVNQMDYYELLNEEIEENARSNGKR